MPDGPEIVHDDPLLAGFDWEWGGSPTGNHRLQLDELASLAEGRHCLEVGCLFGASTLAMASTAISVLTVDCFAHAARPEVHDLAWKIFRENALPKPNISLVYDDSMTALPMLYDLGARFGMAFVDGWHFMPQVESDLRWAWRLLNDDGILAVDDYQADDCPEVTAWVDKLFGEPWRIIESHGRHQDGKIWLSRKQEEVGAVTAESSATYNQEGIS